MKKWLRKGVLLTLCVSLLSGCTIETSGGTEEKEEDAAPKYYLYTINDTETDLVREEYTPEDASTEGMILELERRISGDGKDRVNILPEGVELSNHELSQNVITLNFEQSYKDMGVIREILVRAALVYNFLQVPEISAVQIKIAGVDLADSKGQPVGPLTSESFAGRFGSEKKDYQFVTLTLYFTDKTGSVLVPETRKLYYSSSLPKEWMVLEQLIEGPSEKGNYPTLPGSANILSAINSDGVCYINFDKNFEEEALAVSPEVAVYSIANSIIEACGVEKVQISVGGNSNKTFRETMELNSFYEVNSDLIQKTETDDNANQ